MKRNYYTAYSRFFYIVTTDKGSFKDSMICTTGRVFIGQLLKLSNKYYKYREDDTKPEKPIIKYHTVDSIVDGEVVWSSLNDHHYIKVIKE